MYGGLLQYIAITGRFSYITLQQLLPGLAKAVISYSYAYVNLLLRAAGVPVLTYTAAGSHVPEFGNFFQQQAAAVPDDLNDPLLKQWKKLDSNPIITQVRAGAVVSVFRHRLLAYQEPSS
jgi:hypothetical protein